jgi:hypothetical protein
VPASQSSPVIVVDGVVPGTRSAADAAVLARAARSTRYFSLLVVGPPELVTDLAADPAGAQAADPARALVTVPPLTLPQVRAYLASWLAATRLPEAPPMIVTVDAALIIGHRAAGNLGRINALAREMIAGGAPVITSWDAWTAVDNSHQSTTAEPSVRPTVWPSPDVLRLINHCRVEAGLAERSAPECVYTGTR